MVQVRGHGATDTRGICTHYNRHVEELCRRVVKVENDYIVKDRVVEDIVEEMMVTIIIPDSDDDSDD